MYWLIVVGHKKVLRMTTFYTLELMDRTGMQHVIQAYGIDAISKDSVILNLGGVKSVFPGAPMEAFDRLIGPIDMLIGLMYHRNLEPYGGEGAFTQ